MRKPTRPASHHARDGVITRLAELPNFRGELLCQLEIGNRVMRPLAIKNWQEFVR